MEKGAPPYHILKLSCGYQKNKFYFVMIIFFKKYLEIFMSLLYILTNDDKKVDKNLFEFSLYEM